MALDTEAAIIANFDFLSREGDVDLDDDDDEEEVNDVIRKTPTSYRHPKFKVIILHCSNSLDKLCIKLSYLQITQEIVDDVDAEAEEVLQELHLLTENEEVNSSDIRSQSMSFVFYNNL